MRIDVNSHGNHVTRAQSVEWKEGLKQIVIDLGIEKIQRINVYNYGSKHTHDVGNSDEMYIFADATFDNGSNVGKQTVEPRKIFNIDNSVEKMFSASIRDNTTIINDEHGRPIAEYLYKPGQGRNVLNILFDIIMEENGIKIMNEIMKHVKEAIEEPNRDMTWSKANDKTRLINAITERSKQALENELEELKHIISQEENRIEDFKKRLSNSIRRLESSRRKIGGEEGYIQEQIKRVQEEIDLIINHDKVEDITMIDGKLEIHTTELHAHDEQNNAYYMGKYRIRLRPEQSEIHFFGGTPRRGYWTRNDPHPHVNGSNGIPCLGNLSGTIAELSSQNQLYALVLSAIDFLESVNTSDSAGERVVNWDMVDEDGNIVEQEIEPVETCLTCGGEYDSDQMISAFNEINDDGELEEPIRVCSNCLADTFHHSDVHDAYVHDDIDEYEHLNEEEEVESNV